MNNFEENKMEINEEYEVEGYDYCDTTAHSCAQDCIFSTAVYTVQE